MIRHSLGITTKMPNPKQQECHIYRYEKGKEHRSRFDSARKAKKGEDGPALGVVRHDNVWWFTRIKFTYHKKQPIRVIENVNWPIVGVLKLWHDWESSEGDAQGDRKALYEDRAVAPNVFPAAISLSDKQTGQIQVALQHISNTKILTTCRREAELAQRSISNINNHIRLREVLCARINTSQYKRGQGKPREAQRCGIRKLSKLGRPIETWL